MEIMKMEDSTNISVESIKFNVMSKEYLKLVDELKTRGLGSAEAADVAMTLLVNYFNFVNNDKFANVATNGLSFSPEEGY